MIELELLGPHADGSQLVFTDKDGERYLIIVDDALKAAIRRGELKLESLPKSGSTLRPRDIQQLLRAGMPAAEIAANYDADIDRINRFLAPIITERNFIVSSALETPVGSDADSPVLSDLVVDRLATRGVDAHTLSWTALREQDEPWQLHLTFVQEAKQRRASWQVSTTGALIKALDEEARWLTETTTPLATNVASLPEGKAQSNSAGEPASNSDLEMILSDLASKRGKRLEPTAKKEQASESKAGLLRFPQSLGEDDETNDQDQTDNTDTGGEQTPTRSISEDEDALPGFESIEVEPSDSKTTPRSSKRRSVPSWDEIVFGTRGN